MTPIKQIEKGIANYIDNEVMAKFPHGTWQKVAISAAVAIAIRSYVGKLADNKALKDIGIVEGDSADIEAYAKEVKRNMPESGVSINIPMLGEVILTAPDIDSILEYVSAAGRS